MKKTFFLLITLLTMQGFAQTSIKPSNATIKFEKEQRPCIIVNLDPEPKTLKQAWKNYLKDNYNFKLKGIGFLTNKDLLSAEAVTIPKISSKAMDFYTNIVEDDNGSEMKIFARYGYDIYISKKQFPKEYNAIYEIVENFMKTYLPNYYEQRLNDTQKRVKELTKESENLQDEISNNTEDIKKLKKEIEEKQDKLKSNTKDLESAKEKLTKRQEKLERIKSSLNNL